MDQSIDVLTILESLISDWTPVWLYDTDAEVFHSDRFSVNRITTPLSQPPARQESAGSDEDLFVPRILITSGPTHEPIDAVRYLGNRSSGKVGCEIARCAAERGWEVRLLIGPGAAEPSNSYIDIHRFESTKDLELLLREHLDWCDCLVMAAAVADYRPRQDDVDLYAKHKRSDEGMTLLLESTPDLLKICADQYRSDQLLVGFALEPKNRLEQSARSKLTRKGIDLIVANPLETMGSETIDARLFGNPDRNITLDTQTDGQITKSEFARWLIDHLDQLIQFKSTSHDAKRP